MSRHPNAERWAELEAGTLSSAARESLEAHAASCEACRAARARVVSVRRAMGALAEGAPPPLNWDRLGARIHWSVSSELRRRQREQEDRRGWTRRLLPFALGGAALAAGIVAVVIVAKHAKQDVARMNTPDVDPVKKIPPIVHEGPKVNPEQIGPGNVIVPSLEGVVTFAQGGAQVNDAPVGLDTALAKGSTIVTSDGRMAVQFGAGTGFVVEPHSQLTIVAFDEGAVDLRVEQGAVSVEVSHRAPKQTFTVSAGARRVAVRGTIFRVARGGDTVDVTCTRGRVAVIDGDEELDVPAGDRVALADAMRVSAAHVETMGDPEMNRMAAQMHVNLVAGVWAGAAQARAGSTAMAIDGVRGAVKIDDLPAGEGSFRIRLTPGRHQIAANGQTRWFDAEAGATMDAPIVQPIGAPHERAGQLRAQLMGHSPELKACHGDGITVHVMIEIDAFGNVNSMNFVGDRASPTVEDCVHKVIDQLQFPKGSAETVQIPVTLH